MFAGFEQSRFTFLVAFIDSSSLLQEKSQNLHIAQLSSYAQR